MATPHVHAEVIKAWADGAQIQVCDHGSWVNVIDNRPLWLDSREYRVKPETRRYRVALLRHIGGEVYPYALQPDQLGNESTFFVRWLTDWIEVEI